MLSEKPWQLEEVLMLLIRLFTSMFIGVVLVSGLHASHWLSPSALDLATLLVGTASFHGVALVLIHRLLQDHGWSWEMAFGFLSPRLGRTLLLALLVTAAIYPVTLCLQEISSRVMELFRLHPVVQSPVQMLQTAESIPMKLLLGFLAVLVAPFVEELVFRGLIYPTLKYHGFPRMALWITSFLFAAIHMNLVILLPLTLLAVVLALLYEATDNLLAPIFAHSFFNFVNFLWVISRPAGSSGF